MIEIKNQTLKVLSDWSEAKKNMRTNNDFLIIKKEEHNMSKDRTPHPNKGKGPQQKTRDNNKI